MRTFPWLLLILGLAVPSLARSHPWSQVGPDAGWPNDMARLGQDGVVVAASRGGVYRMPIAGEDWIQTYHGPNIEPRSIATNAAGHIFLGSEGQNGIGFVRSTDDGVSWQVVANALSSSLVTDLLVLASQHILACTAGNGLYRSTDNGTTFASVAGFPASQPSILASSPNGALLAGVNFAAVNLYRSVDGGVTWLPSDAGIPADVSGIVVDPNDPSGNTYYVAAGDKIYKSTDGGINWASLGAPAVLGYTDVAVTADGSVYGANYGGFQQGGKVFRTTNQGATWAEEAGLPGNPVGRFLVTPEHLYLALKGPGPFVRKNDGSGWVRATSGMKNSFVSAVIPDEAESRIYAVTIGLGIYSSTDAGLTWSPGTGIPVHEIIYSVDAASAITYASGAYQGIYTSTNGGSTWTVRSPITATTLASDDQGQAYAGLGSRIYRSTNQGVSWPQLAQLPGVQGIAEIVCRAAEIYVATTNKGVYRSTNNGVSFAEFNTGLTNLNTNTLAIDPDPTASCAISVGTSTGVFDLYEPESTWQLNASYASGQVKRLRKTIEFQLAVEDLALKLQETPCVWEGVVPPEFPYYSDYRAFQAGPSILGEDAQVVEFVGSLGYGLWRYADAPSTEVDLDPTGALPESKNELRIVGQNPFERATTLEFELRSPGAVTLEVFDAGGRSVATLLQGWRGAGRHTVEWDAAGQTSGIYFSRLSIRGAVRTRRVVLVR